MKVAEDFHVVEIGREADDRARSPVVRVIDEALDRGAVDVRPATCDEGVADVDVVETRLEGIGRVRVRFRIARTELVSIELAAAVVGDAVAPVEATGGPHREEVGDDHGLAGRFELDLVEGTVGRAERDAGGSRRLLGDHADHARRSVPAIGARLGAAEHVDVLDVEELGQLAGGRVHVDLVVVDGDRRRGIGVEVAEPDAANEEGRIRRGEGRSNFEVRGELGDITEVGSADGFEVVRVEGDVRDFFVLEELRRARSDHDHLFHGSPRIFFLSGSARRGERVDNTQGAGEQDQRADPMQEGRSRGSSEHPGSGSFPAADRRRSNLRQAGNNGHARCRHGRGDGQIVSPSLRSSSPAPSIVGGALHRVRSWAHPLPRECSDSNNLQLAAAEQVVYHDSGH